MSVLGTVVGQLLGGWLVTVNAFGMGWRSIFLINMPVGLVALAVAFVLLPRSGAVGRDLRKRLDVAGHELGHARHALPVCILTYCWRKGGTIMVAGATAFGMVLVALGMVLTPGPNIDLPRFPQHQPRRAGTISLAGTAVGFLIYMTMANVGLAAVFVTVPWLFTALKAAGAAYLIYLLKPGAVSFCSRRESYLAIRGRNSSVWGS